MKPNKYILTSLLLTVLIVGTAQLRAADTTNNFDKTGQKGTKAKPYPLEKCLVSGEKLGEMGKPVVLTYEGQEMKFCCKDCIKDFNKEPAKYLKKLEEEVKKQKETKGK